MQYFFLSDRFFEIPDIIANIIGSIAGTVFVYLFLKR
jgi:VanZ family protein